MPDILYRYDEIHFCRGFNIDGEVLPGSDIRLSLSKYSIIKKTEKGVWIEPYKEALLGLKNVKLKKQG